MHMSRGRLWLPLSAVVIFFLLPAFAIAQSAPCADEVRQAEIEYRDGNFEEAERLLAGCLDGSLIGDREAIDGYRILALSRLQLGDIPGARIAVLRVFARQPGYMADPVQDPPGYQALVETVRRQLDDPAFRVEVEELRRQPLAEPVTAVRAYRQRRAAYLRGATGFNSYGGERGAVADNAFEDFAENAGVLFGIGFGYNVFDFLAIGLGYEFGNYPTLNDQKARIFPVIDREMSSTWVQSLGLEAMVRILPGMFVNPYVRGGPGIALARINDEVRVGTSVEFGGGIDLPISGEVGFFADMSARFVFPGEAMDLVARNSDSDLLTLMRIGLTWKVGRLFD